ncbi:MAG: hypothetical protein U1F61_17080 [Opitutaceae bacterium]
MPLFIVFLILGIATGCANVRLGRIVTIADWLLPVPLDVESRVTEGPDFLVTYMEFRKLNASAGVYEGGYPQSFAPAGSTTQHDVIAGREIYWKRWEERDAGGTVFRAETKVADLYIFISAPSEDSLVSLQKAIRALKRKKA